MLTEISTIADSLEIVTNLIALGGMLVAVMKKRKVRK